MSEKIVQIKRVFKFNDRYLPDPNPKLSPNKVMALYSNDYSELTTATLTGPVYEDDQEIYSFSTSFKPKG